MQITSPVSTSFVSTAPVTSAPLVSEPTSAVRLTGRERMLLASDLLPPCDFLAFLFTAYLTSILFSITAVPNPTAIAITSTAWIDRSNMAFLGASLASFILYDQHFSSLATRHRIGSLIRSFALRFFITVSAVVLIGHATQLLEALPLRWVVSWLCGSFVLTALARYAAARRLQLLQSRGELTESIAVVGSGAIAEGLDRQLKQQSAANNIEFVGVFDDMPATTEGSQVQQLDRLMELGAARRLDWIVIAVPDNDEQRISSLVKKLQTLSVPIALCPQGFGYRLPVKDVDYVSAGLPVILLSDRPIKRWNAMLKTAEDMVLSVLITLMLLPVLALIALAIRLDSKGPIIFKQRRHTFNNTEFDIYKFRTMHWDPNGASAELKQTTRNDARVTRVGRWLRESSLDELPQLFNVLRGEMSLIGPRPHAVNMRTQDRLGWEITDRYAHRHRVKPGMTGWSQVNGARGATDTIEQLQRRIDLDLFYIDNWSLWLDIKILLMTFRVVIKRTNAF